MTIRYQLYIDGKYCEEQNQEQFPSINPYTRDTWALVPQASDAQVAKAIESARRAFETTWRKVSGYERSRLLNRLADLLEADATRMGTLESTDNGKVIRETTSQMVFAARQYRFFAGLADKLWGRVIPLDKLDVFDYSVREPLGVAVLITAWNSPMGLLSNKLAPALAAGNCVVIKPSEYASVTTLEFTKFIEKAGFPKGVVNVVTGDSRVGKALLASGRIDRVSFTGSPQIGREIAASAGRALVPATLELGGKSPNIIFEDANIEKAIIGALSGIFAATGQTCIAGSRLLVQRAVYNKVCETLIERAPKIRLGDPTDPETEMGTVANEPQFDRVMASIGSAVREGAVLRTGGKPAKGDCLGRGLFIEPTIFIDVDNSMSIAQEEVFGPVLSIIPFETEDDAVKIANQTKYGLASGVWTTNLSRALRVTRAVHAGTVWVNTYRAVGAQAPFGGMRDSGYGRERGQIAIDEFTTTKNVMVDFSDEARDPFAIKI